MIFLWCSLDDLPVTAGHVRGFQLETSLRDGASPECSFLLAGICGRGQLYFGYITLFLL